MIKNTNYNNYHVCYNKHDKFLIELPKLTQKVECFNILYSPKEFNNALLCAIYQAHHHIYLVTLYLEHDQGGKKIIEAILYTKKLRPTIKIKIIVDWNRAQRTRIGESKNYTNLDWYHDIIHQYPNIEILIYGIPIHINEILGVLHLKGFIIDDTLLYSGANINNEYLHIYNKYRQDRYHIIQNPRLSHIMLEYIDKELLTSKAIKNIGHKTFFKKTKNKKNNIRLFRRNLRKVCYNYQNNAIFNELSVTPLVGLGKNSILNQTIYHLIASVRCKIILCTPYFNIPNILIHNLIYLLRNGKKIEIIVGDKIANDFYAPNLENHPFRFISVIPYLYEVNLRSFLKKLQNYIDNKQLIVRLWKKNNHGYHIKGIWIDDEWQLITGSNLNPRSLRFDLENALLFHDPMHELIHKKNHELNKIRIYTNLIKHYTSVQKISDYPYKVKQFIKRIRQIKFDRLLRRLL